jgi:hypothetical protein
MGHAEPERRRRQLARVEPVGVRRQPREVEGEGDDEDEGWRYSTSLMLYSPEPPSTPSWVPTQSRSNQL